MNSINAVLLVFVFSLLTGCSHYSDITGKVRFVRRIYG